MMSMSGSAAKLAQISVARRDRQEAESNTLGVIERGVK
jgi:hypothetical protein